MLTKKLINAVLVALVGWFAVGCVDGEEDELGSFEHEIAAPIPQNLRVTAVSSVRITIEWDSIGLPGEQYAIFRGPDANTQSPYTSNYPASSTTFTDTSLTPGTQYCYHVRAIATGFSQSGPSNVVCNTTNAGATPPTGVMATATSSSTINVTWDPVTNAERYYVYHVTSGPTYTQAGSVAAPATQFTVGGLAPNTTYTFVVRSQIQTTYSGYSAEASATTFPLGLEGYYRFDETSGSVANDLSGYNRDATLANGATFITTDRAPLKDENDHNPASVGFPTVTSVVNAPIVKNFVDNTSISLWVKRTTTNTTFNIAGRRAAGCGPISWLLGHNASGLYFAGQTGSILFNRSLPTNNTWVHLGVVNNNGTFNLYVNGQLASSVAYSTGTVTNTEVPLQLGNVGGCNLGGSLRVDEFKMWSRALSASEMELLGTPPPPPANLRAAEIKSNRITITWDVVPDATKYHVYKGTAQGNATFLTTVNTNSFTWGNQQPNTTTWWWVLSVRNGLLSTKSNEISVTTLGPPPAPTNLTGTVNTSFSPARVDLAWTGSARAVLYRIYKSTDNVNFTQVTSVPATSTTYRVGGLSAGTTYYFYVKAEDDGRVLSAPSNTVTAAIP